MSIDQQSAQTFEFCLTSVEQEAIDCAYSQYLEVTHRANSDSDRASFMCGWIACFDQLTGQQHVVGIT